MKLPVSLRPLLTRSGVRLVCLLAVAALYLLGEHRAGRNLLFGLVTADVGLLLVRSALRPVRAVLLRMRKWAGEESIRRLAENCDEWRAREDDQARNLNFESVNIINLGAQTSAFSLFLRPFGMDNLSMPTPCWLTARVSVRLNVPPEDFTFVGSEIWPVTTYELALRACLNNIAKLISVSPPRGRLPWREKQRTGQLSIRTDDWKSKVLELMKSAKIIFILPGQDPGVLWEIETILASPDLAQKTLFVSPRTRGGKLEMFRWTSTYATIEKATGLRIPWPSDEQALFFGIAVSPTAFGTLPVSKDGKFRLSAMFSPFDHSDLKRLNGFLQVCTRLSGLPAEGTPIATFHYLPDVPLRQRVPFTANGTVLPSLGGSSANDT